MQKTEPAATRPAAPPAASANYLTTREAAELLGVSVGTVLNMVERGQLEAWRTDGGHRRITMASVLAHLARRSGGGQPPEPERRGDLDVMVIEDDEFLLEVYRDQFANWELPLNLRFAGNGVEGLIELGRERPDVLIIDLRMPVVDGFAVVRTLRDRPGFAGMDIIVITGLDEDRIARQGGLPPGIVVWPKPVPFHQLRGFLEARLASLQRAGSR